MARKRNPERRARLIDKRNDATKGEGVYKIERGAQKGPDASSRLMPDANGKGDKNKRPGKKKRTDGRSGYYDNPANRRSKVNKPKSALYNKKRVSAGVKYLLEKREGLTRKKAVIRTKANITADRANRSYGGGFDWAKDGIGAKDIDMGTKRNNIARKGMGKKRNITVKANVKGAKKMGTGKVIHRKKVTA
jgi:hypothetical protein